MFFSSSYMRTLSLLICTSIASQSLSSEGKPHKKIINTFIGHSKNMNSVKDYQIFRPRNPSNNFIGQGFLSSLSKREGRVYHSIYV